MHILPDSFIKKYGIDNLKKINNQGASMNQKMNLKEGLTSTMSRYRKLFDSMILKGHWKTELWRDGQLVGTFEAPNDITTVGKNNLFDVMFNTGTQTAAANWCAGLINNAGFTGYTPATDTMASHTGWTEWTAYSQSARPAWGQSAASGAAITNGSPIIFDINGTGTVRGMFITTVNTKSGTTGILWSGASYTATIDVVPGDQIRSTYSLSC